jgi:hypothetical protein
MTWASENFYARQDVTSHGFATLCRNCGLPVTRRGPSARRSPTGYAHWGSWLGIRCPGRLTGAQPGRQLTEAEYLAWADERTGSRGPGRTSWTRYWKD